MIRYGKISQLTATGKRNNNEDSLRIGENGVFLVCDGVGGVDKGEVASEIVADTFIRVYGENPDADPQDALREAENALSIHIDKHPDSSGMATTLTFSQVRKEGILVAWVGDSRVYQFRKGKLVYRTNDHSWVNEAVEAGILTPEEAVNHPKSNVITRAVQGTDRPVKADQVLLKDIKPGDCIMHCSDGILEAWDDEDLSALFNSTDDVDDMMAKLASDCETDSRDNYTAIIYRIDEVKTSGFPETQSLNKPHAPRTSVTNEESYAYGSSVKSKGKWVDGILNRKVPLPQIVIFFLLLSLVLFLIVDRGWFGGETAKKDTTHSGRSNHLGKVEAKDSMEPVKTDTGGLDNISPSGTNVPQKNPTNPEVRKPEPVSKAVENDTGR